MRTCMTLQNKLSSVASVKKQGHTNEKYKQQIMGQTQ